jgi:hypothetical protein
MLEVNVDILRGHVKITIFLALLFVSTIVLNRYMDAVWIEIILKVLSRVLLYDNI